MRIFEIFDAKDTSRIVMINVDQIKPSRYQPRLRFDEEAMAELSQSIQENGLIQPLTVRWVGDYYEIIAGERRFRACKMAGYKEVPCYIMTPSEDQAAQMSLVENVQRENLSAIEEARSYLQIMRQASLTQEQVARKIGKSQSSVANKIRLLNLPEEIQEGVVEGKLTERHARALLNVPPEKQKDVYHHILDADMNVRETETYIEKIITPKVKKRRHKTKGYSRNIQIGLNSVAQCIKLIEKMGITVRSETKETDDDVHVVITFPKNKGE